MKHFLVVLLILGVGVAVVTAQIDQCKTDSDCKVGHSCVFGYCSSNDTRKTFERLQKAKTLRRSKKLQLKVQKRSITAECVDDFECKPHERCRGGACSR